MPAYVHYLVPHKINVVTGKKEWKCSLCGLIINDEDKEECGQWDEEITQNGCTIDRETLSEESGLRPFERD